MSENSGQTEDRSSLEASSTQSRDGVSEANPNVGEPGETLPSEFLDNLPPEIRETMPPEVREFFSGGNLRAISASLSMTQSGRIDPVSSKITEQHITDIIDINRKELDYEDRQAERDYQERKEEGRIFAGLAVLGVIAICGICALAAWQVPDFLPEVVTGSVGTGAGLLGGYGIGRSRQR